MISARVADWYPVSVSQIAPVVLVTDPALVSVVSAERCAEVLRTPRAGEG